jgi:hypothetical protein
LEAGGPGSEIPNEIVSTFETRACPPEIVNAISEALEREREKPNPLLHLTGSDTQTQH